MANIQKIILLVLVVPLALFPGGLIFYVLLFDEPKFETAMWIPIGMSILGVCSFIFHFKTKGFYKLLKENVDLPKVEPVFWILDIAFGIIYIILSLYAVYLMYAFPTKKSTLVLLVFIIPMLVAGAWTVFEAFYLNKLIQNHKFANRHSEIDDIKGDVGE
ncbi:MAG: hypothetical protein ACOH2D_13645 [Gelidibacter sp.]